MTPPKATVVGNIADSTETLPAVSVCLTVMAKRADFLKAARAKRQAMPGFILQARKRGPLEVADQIRIGFTCSKKVGNAVARNRAKRRLRAVAREVLSAHGLTGWDYVLIGRAGATANRKYTDLTTDMTKALSRFHGERK